MPHGPQAGICVSWTTDGQTSANLVDSHHEELQGHHHSGARQARREALEGIESAMREAIRHGQKRYEHRSDGVPLP